MKPRAVLLDLDGTLADTAPDFSLAINALRTEHGLGELPLDEVRRHCSWGGARLTRLALNLDEPDPERTAELLDHYARFNGRQARLFPSAERWIEACRRSGIAWGIVTNKPRRFGEPLIEALLGERTPLCIYPEDVETAKPAPDMLLLAAERLDLSPQQCCYVGDHSRDFASAQAAGIAFIRAEWGYIDCDDEWPEAALARRADDLMHTLSIAAQLTGEQAA
ncbi:MAG: HAD-IA family hydrolase [Gammaproteobacteria bacterium AqS3]|nr:HAD-IA family hydrolase [Gammaproteobacteria bacterium AqS3]